jgi:uncharacterized membrane protein YtjA (UPF0391 family)
MSIKRSHWIKCHAKSVGFSDQLNEFGRYAPGHATPLNREVRRITMLSWAITFLIIAIIAAVLGFGGIAGTATGIAKILFVVLLVMFIASFFFGRRGRG